MSQTKYKLSTMFGEDSPVTTALLCVLTVSWLQAATLTQMLADLRRRNIVQAGRSVAPAQVCTVLCCTVLYCTVLWPPPRSPPTASRTPSSTSSGRTPPRPWPRSAPRCPPSPRPGAGTSSTRPSRGPSTSVCPPRSRR